jgi:hypothetical protein
MTIWSESLGVFATKNRTPLFTTEVNSTDIVENAGAEK